MTPELTIVIPTQGRATLRRCLMSMRPAHHRGYRAEIIVVADTHSPLLMDVESVAHHYGARYLEHDAGTHNWGYCQLQYGYERALGDYILNIGDDDVYLPGAFEIIREQLGDQPEVCPALFRAELHPSPHRGCHRPVVLWEERGSLERGRVTGQNLACPNVPGRIGFWWDDFCQMEATINLWDGRVAWHDAVIARCY